MLGGALAIVLALAAPTLGACPPAVCADVPALVEAGPGPLEIEPLEDSPPVPDAAVPDSLPAPIERPRAIDRLVEIHLPGPESSAFPVDDGEGSASPRSTDGGPSSTPEPAVPTGHPTTERDQPTALEARPSGEDHAAHPAGVHATGQGFSEEARRAHAIGLAIGLLAIGLYHRLTKDEALEHPSRRRILSILDDDPGLGTNEVADRLDVSYRTARHHLEKLAGFGLVTMVDEDERTRWCLPADADGLAEPMTDAQASVLELVGREEGLHLSEIARRLEMAKATAKFQLDKLADQGLVEDEQVGPLRRFAPTDAGRDRVSDG